MSRSCASVSATPTLARSIAWPPAMPALPAARASRRHRRACTASGTLVVVGREQLEGQRLQRITGQQRLASPNFTCTVGLPRRSTSLSMQGMSSCTSE